MKCLFDDLALVILLFFYAFIVDFEQVNTGWAIIPKCFYRKDRLEEIVCGMVSVQQKGIKPFSTKRSYIPKQTCNFQLHICLSIYDLHCVKNVQITSFFWSVFSHIWAESREIQSISAFGLNPERYEVSLRIHSEYGKLQTRKNSVFGHISHSAFCGHQVLKS